MGDFVLGESLKVTPREWTLCAMQSFLVVQRKAEKEFGRRARLGASAAPARTAPGGCRVGALPSRTRRVPRQSPEKPRRPAESESNRQAGIAAAGSLQGGCSPPAAGSPPAGPNRLKSLFGGPRPHYSPSLSMLTIFLPYFTNHFDHSAKSRGQPGGSARV